MPTLSIIIGNKLGSYFMLCHVRCLQRRTVLDVLQPYGSGPYSPPTVVEETDMLRFELTDKFVHVQSGSMILDHNLQAQFKNSQGRSTS